MKSFTRTLVAAPALGLAALLLSTAPALAASGAVEADLQPVPLNGANATGNAMVSISGTTLTFTLAANGLLADAPHAAHIHYGEDSRNSCPAATDDADGGGTLNTTETGVAYGPIVVSLTNAGDTSPESGLAVDRFGVGDNISYSRGDVQVTEEIAQDILSGEAAVVVHGVDHDGSGVYDGETVSDLDPSLPTEATDPAICGVLNVSQMSAAPQGGVATGMGATSGVENAGLIAAGGLAAAGGAALLYRRRQLSSN